MASQRCTECGESFDAKGAWQRLCWRCWRDQENSKLESAAYRRGYRDGLAERRTDPPARGGLDSELLRQLVTLCHPDRHPAERFELANRVTARLLELLARDRAAA